MATQDKLNLLLNTKEAIKNAIVAKGVSVSDTDTFASYAEKIAQIEGGGGGGTVEGNNGDAIRAMYKNKTEQDISYLFYQRIVDQDMLDAVYDFSKITTSMQAFVKAERSDASVKFDGSKTLSLNTAGVSQLKTFNNCLIGGDLVVDLNSLSFSLVNFFNGCSYVESIKVLNAEACKMFNSIFAYCVSLKSIEIDWSGCTTMYQAFQNCSSLEELDLSTMSASCTNFTNTFTNCTKLKTLIGLNINGINTEFSAFGTATKALERLTLQAGNTACSKFQAQYTSIVSGDYFQEFIDSLPTNTASGVLVLKAADQSLVTEEQTAAIEAKGWTISYS